MSETVALEAALDQDLTEFSRYLWQQGVSHRLLRLEDRQLLLVGSPEQAQWVQECYRQGPRLQAASTQVRASGPPALGRRFLLLLYTLPVTLCFILLSLFGYGLVRFDPNFEWVGLLTFVAFEQRGAEVVFYLPLGQLWRLLTPIFLHFSLLHIVFNMLWLWDLGRRIELSQGRLRLLGLILLTGLGSNIAQFVSEPSGIFGGMSGVIYGLLGYGWIWSRMRPERSLQIPPAVIVMMVVWLLLCMFGFASLFGVGAVANAAHLGGLVLGMALGALYALLSR